MTGEEKVKKNRDPIFTVCLVIFLLAAVAVVGVYINDHYIEKDDTKVAYGDTVTVNYTGSYYAYVDDREHAMVFDTSYRSVADNDKIIKSNSFASSKFEPLEFKVGGTTVLEAFGLSAVGHQIGDKYTVMIPADEAYDGAVGVVESDIKTTMPSKITMSKTAFSDLYDVKLPSTGGIMFESVYGWNAYATPVDGNNVLIRYAPEAGQTYDYIGNEDSKVGKVQFKVTSVDTENITYEYVFSETKSTGNGTGVMMIELDFGQGPIYVTDVGASTFTYKISDEKVGMDLYFEIEIVSIN